MRILFGLGLGLMASAALASPPENGCYDRVYSKAHLADQPQQHVAAVRLHIFDAPSGPDRWADLDVRLRDGSRHSQTLYCFSMDGAAVCGVDCDGGLMAITRQDGKGLVFRTDYLMVGDTEGCGGAIDLAEVPGQAVSYRLDRASDAICTGD